ncbi:MAG: TraR/DksA C4-type zinc finger protein [Candidatus Pacebacteria bacterium]|nr:TraR/DksA C4-type zinc finger protein [Candidatus Paceibacterota bacterium]
MIQNIDHLKTKLEEEKATLEASLVDVGQKNPSNPADWEGKSEPIDAERSDKIDTADNIEEYETNSAVIAELEVRLKNIDAALARIENGTYGICKICGEKIEDDRLEANPAANTCKAHMND